MFYYIQYYYKSAQGTDVESYNPAQNIKERPVLRNLIVASDAKRKAFA